MQQPVDQLWEFLRDPVWDFVGTVLSAVLFGIGLLVTALGNARSRERASKDLTLDILANESLSPMNPELIGKLTVSDAGKTVENSRLFRFRLSNSGEESVKPGDYIEPIRLRLAAAANIIEAATISSYPHNLGMRMTQTDNSTVELTATLLNPGDSFMGRIIAADCDDTLRADYRIVDVKAIRIRPYLTPEHAAPGSPLLRFGIAAVLATGLAFIIQTALFNIDAILGWFVAINMVAFGLFALDKARAITAKRSRVPSTVFYLLALVGGAGGILLGMYLLLHKVRMRRFRHIIWGLFLIQTCVVVLILAL